MKATRTVTVLATTAMLALPAGCGQSGPTRPADPPGTLAAKNISRLEADADAPVARVVAGMRYFAEEFAPATSETGENSVFSPVSLAYAFAMLRASADGATAGQLDELFGYPDPGVHTAFNVLSRDVVTTEEAPPTPAKGATRAPGAPPSPPVVSIANGLFVQAGLKLGPDFLRTLAEQYGAGAQAVDFTSGTAKEIIDAWVKKETAGRIDKLFDELDPSTSTVLANAVYLKADWQTPFDLRATKDEDFRRADGGTVRAPMMHFINPQVLNYVRQDGWQAVELPYAGGELAMWVLVPTSENAAPPALSAQTLGALTDAEPKLAELAMPKWDFGTEVELLPVLKGLGLTALGDLPGISRDAFVADAIHRANITVDEYGTEAAAVTGIATRVSAAPKPTVTIRADQPFAFAIMHKPTGAPVFLGTVADPTAN